MTTPEQKTVNQLSINQAVMSTDLKNLADDITEVKSSVHNLDAKFDRVIEKLERKFASKWVERAMTLVITLIITTFVAILISTVFHPTNTGTVNSTKTLNVESSSIQGAKTSQNASTSVSERPTAIDSLVNTVKTIL